MQAPVDHDELAPATEPAAHEPTSGKAMLLLAAAITAVLAGGISAAAPTPQASPFQETQAAVVPAPTAPMTPRAAETVTAPPMRIEIPRIGISADIDAVGKLDDGTMAVPEDYARTAWYEGLEAPGEIGTAVIVGHLDSRSGPAVFFEVPSLRAGDEISVARADGTTVRFVVERTEQYDKARFPTVAVYGPTDRPTLRLITCGGTFDRSRRHYRDNVVVYAHAEEAT